MNVDRLYAKAAYRTKPAIRAKIIDKVRGKYTCQTVDGRIILNCKGNINQDYPAEAEIWVNLGQVGGSYTILEICASAGGPNG